MSDVRTRPPEREGGPGPRPAAAEVPHTLTEQAPRTLGTWDQLGLWGNLGVSLLGFTGAVAVLQPGGPGTARLSLAAALLAVVVGTSLGAVAIAATAVLGARTGAPSMVLLRGVFGARASVVPTVLNVVQMIGWGTFEIVTIATALGQVLPGVPRWTWVLLIGVLTTVLATRPLGSVRLLRRYVTVAVVVALAYLTSQLLAHPLHATGSGGGGGLSLGIDATLAVAISWVPMAADYSRHSRTPRAAATGALIGYTVMQVACYGLGLVAVLSVLTRGGDVFATFLAVPLGVVAFAVVTVRELDQSFANVYSTTVSTQNLRPRWDRRAISMAVGALTTLLALVVDIYDYASFLSLIGSVFVPLFAVLVADRLCLRDRPWDLSETAPTRWVMLLPWALGFAAYQLLNPGQVPLWTHAWQDLAAATGFSPRPWMSASLVSFAVAALATALVHVPRWARGRRSRSPEAARGEERRSA
ncbi:putative hydroxymethylpyrimidine transporter CytX [Nocardioides korecus]